MSTSPSSDPRKRSSMVEHTRKQLKYIATGGTITWFTAIFPQLRSLLHDTKGSARLATVFSFTVLKTLTFSRIFTLASVLLGVTTILIFLYLVFLPRVRGVNSNVCSFIWHGFVWCRLIIYMQSVFKLEGFSWISSCHSSLFLHFAPQSLVLNEAISEMLSRSSRRQSLWVGHLSCSH